MGLAGSSRELLKLPGAANRFEKIEFDDDDERIVAPFLRLP
jgi:hypothetical protein